MKKTIYSLLLFSFTWTLSGQSLMTPEKLIQLNFVSGLELVNNNKDLVYSVSNYNLDSDSKTNKTFSIPIGGGVSKEILNSESILTDDHISPNGEFIISTQDVKMNSVTGQDFYDDVAKSNVKIYDALNYRHWDTWEDGAFTHVMYKSTNPESSELIDIMINEPFDCPQKPFGGSEDYLWSPDGEKILYVTKKKEGTDYAVSTNTDIYEYNLATKKTINLTASNKGYDTSPAFSTHGQLAWLQMKRDGYESDKNDIIISRNGNHINLTADWDGTVNSFIWGDKGDAIYFVAPTLGTVQLFELKIPKSDRNIAQPRQITSGQFDVHGIVAQHQKSIVVSRRDMNHAPDLFNVNMDSGKMIRLTDVNKNTYSQMDMGNIKKRMTKTVDGKDLLSWVIYPPNFDPTKKYPTLLYCQGGPQGALSQFYSSRWNFQLMAANGYIIIAPNRRGMPGYGVEWNEQISKDYGGLNMQDYLVAIDDISKESYVDNDRLGCIGASYGGYSCFYLAAIHEGRFKTFIAHDGIYNWKSMYGTTEEMFFVNWDLGGAYWDKNNIAAQKAYNEFNPAEKVGQWTAPILIIQGGLDYRVPIGQGLEAFQAAQLQGIKSKLLYFPEENHWVLDKQNSLVWQREFYKWLRETL